MAFWEFMANLVPGRDYSEIRALHFDDDVEPVATATVVRSMAARTIGLLGRMGLPFDEAMVFVGEHGIHTHGMKFALDVLFVKVQDRSLNGSTLCEVLYAEEFVPPGTVRTKLGANGVIEFAGGALRRYGHRVPKVIRLTDKLPVIQTSFLAPR